MSSDMEQKASEQIEAGEHLLNEMLEEFNPPLDWQNPEWAVNNKVHNWRNYVSDAIKDEWFCFSGKQRLILSSCFEEMADRENERFVS